MNTTVIILALVALAVFWRFGRPWLNTRIETVLGRWARRKVAEQVLVKIKLADETASDEERRHLWRAEQLIDELVTAAGVGELDGHEMGGGFLTLHLHGPSADRLFEVVSPALAHFEPPPGSVAVLRYGEAGAQEATVELLAA